MNPMRAGTAIAVTTGSARRALGLLAALLACAICLSGAVASASMRAGARDASAPFPCSGPGSAHRPCHFATPSGNIRCLWTPSPNSVACVLRASGRAYRLRPTGRAKVIRLRLARAGLALPRGDQIVFPQSMSCRATRNTMTCNQDFGLGAFTLARGASHRS
jgi:hypothetical protein